MTNLTKEQIEKEREVFEKWFLNWFGYSIANESFSENGCYRNTLTDNYWQPWLARAEMAKEEMRSTNFQIGRVARHLHSVKNSSDSEIKYLRERVKAVLKILDELYASGRSE